MEENKFLDISIENIRRYQSVELKKRWFIFSIYKYGNLNCSHHKKFTTKSNDDHTSMFVEGPLFILISLAVPLISNNYEIAAV